MKAHKFEVTGTFYIDKKHKPILDCRGNICGFKLKDGRTVKLVVGLEVANPEETDYQYITSDKDTAKIGFELLEYDRTDFEK